MNKKIKTFVADSPWKLDDDVNEFLKEVIYHDLKFTAHTFQKEHEYGRSPAEKFVAVLVYTDRRTYGNDTLVIQD